jgi:paraquat-inducible protein B
MDDQLHVALATLEKELSKLKKSVDYIESAKTSVEAAKKIITQSKELSLQVANHSANIEKLIKKIDKVDFPSRLDKIDIVIVTINQNITNLQTRLESAEKSLKDEVNHSAKDVLAEIKKQSDKQLEISTQISKVQKANTIMVSVIIFLIVLLGLLIKFTVV